MHLSVILFPSESVVSISSELHWKNYRPCHIQIFTNFCLFLTCICDVVSCIKIIITDATYCIYFHSMHMILPQVMNPYQVAKFVLIVFSHCCWNFDSPWTETCASAPDGSTCCGVWSCDKNVWVQRKYIPLETHSFCGQVILNHLQCEVFIINNKCTD